VPEGLIEKAVEAELQVLLDQYENVTDLRGRQAVVRNGYLPEREILTGLGPVPVRIPKVRDRSQSGIKFNSALVPPYVRKAQRVEAALPVAVLAWDFDGGHAGGVVGPAGRRGPRACRRRW
jgi:putative transposase